MDLVVVDGVVRERPDQKEQEGIPDTVHEAHGDVDPRRGRVQEEQDQEGQAGEEHAVGADLAAAELVAQLRRKEHDDGDGQVLTDCRKHREAGVVEVVVEEVRVVAHLEHLGSQEEEARDADSHEGTAGEQRLDDTPGLALFLLGLGGGDDAFLGELIGNEVANDGEDCDHGDADDDSRVAHGFDAVTGHIAEAGQRHCRHCAEGRSDGTEHRKRGTFLVVGSDDRCERAVGNVDAGVNHSEENVGDGGPDEVAGLGHAGDPDKHEHRGKRDRDREDLEPAAVAAVFLALRAVDDAAPERVVDGIPDAGDNEHDEDAHDGDLENVCVILLKHRLHKTEDQKRCEVAHRIADLVFHGDAARTGNEGLVRSPGALFGDVDFFF